MDIWSAIIGGALTVIGVVIGAILNHHLEARRNRIKMLFESKSKIYGEILGAISYSFLSGEKKLEEALADKNFKTKMGITFGSLLSQGRLMAGVDLENKLREFFDCEMAIWDAIENGREEKREALSIKRGVLCWEIERLMKVDLGISD